MVGEIIGANYLIKITPSHIESIENGKTIVGPLSLPDNTTGKSFLHLGFINTRLLRKISRECKRDHVAFSCSENVLVMAKENNHHIFIVKDEEVIKEILFTEQYENIYDKSKGSKIIIGLKPQWR